MRMLRRTPTVWLVVLVWLGMHVIALLLAGRASPEGAPWWAWGMVPDSWLRRLGGDVPSLVRMGEVRRVLTFAFLHPMALNLVFSIWILLGTGRTLERALGSARFWIVFLVGAAAAGTAHALFGSGLLVGGWYPILGTLGGLLIWAFLSPDPSARASRGSALLFLVIVGALSLVFGGSLVADIGGLAGGAIAMLLLGPWRHLAPPGALTKGAALVLLLLLVVAAGLQAFDTTTLDSAEVRSFLRNLAEVERRGRGIVRAPHKASESSKNDLARRVAELRSPPCLREDTEAREALNAYLDVWMQAARGDMPDPFAFDRRLEATRDAWRAHENEVRALADVPRSWSGGSP